ncbi:uncharacterized protein LOC121720035 [Alosa sapidissima]|uniref:uncharacterized protein LOC121720035 n=1 Tax=Alosa sapidissima TaxID=34773 RepID=UPI001C08A242|nr:uncharacterized protein LOC121720035 [Alosa sapidissima]
MFADGTFTSSDKASGYHTFRKVGLKYYVTDGLLATFDEGLKFCSDAGATLVLPRTEEENQALANVHAVYPSTHPYIGATDRKQEGRFSDLNDKLLTFTKWGSGEPAREDMLTVLAMAWNDRKIPNMANMLSHRYAKTVKREAEEHRILEEQKTTSSLMTPCCNTGLQKCSTCLKSYKVWKVITSKEKIEGLYLSIKQRKLDLYRLQDSNKRRHHVWSNIREDTSAFSMAVDELRAQGSVGLPTPDELLATGHFVWPWETHGTRPSDLQTKIMVFDQYMLVSRLEEEKKILIQEMCRHTQSLQNMLTSAEGMLQDQSMGDG